MLKNFKHNFISQAQSLSVADAFSLSRLALLLPLLAALPDNPKLALAWYGIMLWTDYLDGFIAKRHHAQSPYGNYLDPASDIIIHGNILLYLIRAHWLPTWLGIIFFIRFLVLILSSWKHTVGRNSTEVFNLSHQKNSLRSSILGKLSFLIIAFTIAATLSINNPKIIHMMALTSSFLLLISLLDYCIFQWKNK
ncbi:MAG TPA: CDP-alcohol phosphatidyltransferase family protein [Gammaproteobacteria bacterium]|nr:CDP-alcohol phosphatidyltransferase family protein [Gammaproteobacteria bacterium]